MRTILSMGLFFLLAMIAALHVYWAFGGLWPASTEQDLVNTVIGAPSLNSMPARNPALFVAALIFSSALVGLVAGGALSFVPRALSRAGALGVGLIFLARGFAGLGGLSIFRTWVVEPFATLNVQFYSPLCLLIGMAFVSLAVTNPKRARPAS